MAVYFSFRRPKNSISCFESFLNQVTIVTSTRCVLCCLPKTSCSLRVERSDGRFPKTSCSLRVERFDGRFPRTSCSLRVERFDGLFPKTPCSLRVERSDGRFPFWLAYTDATQRQKQHNGHHMTGNEDGKAPRQHPLGGIPQSSVQNGAKETENG